MFLAALHLAAALAAQQSFPIPPLPERSARTQSYRMEAELSDDLSRITGTSTIELHNPSTAPIPDVQFHLYWNAFKNNRSTWLREQASVGRRRDRKVRGESYGACDVRSLRLVGTADPSAPGLSGAADLLPRARFIAPDDGNADDETVMRVELPQPVPPGGRAVLELSWECVVPRVVARSGRKDDFLLVAQWFPKLGVWEAQDGGAFGWNCHQFHANTEFFGEYASYDVTLVVPPRFEKKIGATGALREGPKPAANGKIAYRFEQDDVHDFAWTADPRFIVEKRRFTAADAENDPAFRAEKELVRRATGLSDDALALRDVDVTILLQPEHADQGDRYFRAAAAPLRFMGLWFGRYPYATLTVVDPRWGSGAGGMEYPTLITAGSRVNPGAREFTPESVTVHEFNHQFFYGLVGTNEFEHAWMDEGFTSYCTAKVLEIAYGDERIATDIGERRFDGRPIAAFPEAKTGLEKLLSLRAFAWPTLEMQEGWAVLPDDAALRVARDLPFLAYAPAKRPPLAALRAGYLSGAPQADRLGRASFAYVDGASYRTNAYMKPATTLATLERVIGREPWVRAMRAYASRYRFQHPQPEDFFRTIVNFAGAGESGLPLRSLFEQTFNGSGLLDYAVLSAKSSPAAARAGLFGAGDARALVSEARVGESFDSEFVVGRKGDVAFPVEVEWKRAGEAPQRETWNGADRWWRRSFAGGPRLEWVRVDPEKKLLLDADFMNNEMRIEGDGGAAMRWTLRALLGAETQLTFFGSLR